MRCRILTCFWLSCFCLFVCLFVVVVLKPSSHSFWVLYQTPPPHTHTFPLPAPSLTNCRPMRFLSAAVKRHWSTKSLSPLLARHWATASWAWPRSWLLGDITLERTFRHDSNFTRAPAKRKSPLLNFTRAPAKRKSPLLNFTRVPAKRKSPLLNFTRAPAKRKSPLLNFTRAPAKRKSPLLNFTRAPAKRKSPLLNFTRDPAKRKSPLLNFTRDPAKRKSPLLRLNRICDGRPPSRSAKDGHRREKTTIGSEFLLF